MLHIFSTTV